MMELSVTLCADACTTQVADVAAGTFTGSAVHLDAGRWELTTTRGAVMTTEGRALTDRDFHDIDSVLVWRQLPGDSNREIVYAGLIVGPGDEPGGRQSDKADRLTIRGCEAYGALFLRQCYPDPGNEPDSWVRVRRAVAGPASNAAAVLVNMNMSDVALPDRRLPGLRATSDGAGEAGRWTFDPTDKVGELVSRICAEGDVTCNVSFEPSPGGFHVRFEAPTDWSDEVTLSDQDDLADFTRGMTAESATVVIASRERTDGDLPPLDRERWRLVDRPRSPEQFVGWRRVESAIRSQPGEAVAEGRAILRQGGRKYWMTAIPIVDQRPWASRYRLGDLVAVNDEGGSHLVPIAEFEVRWSATESYVRPVLGAPTQRASRQRARFLRQMTRRITRIPQLLLEGGPVDDLA